MESTSHLLLEPEGDWLTVWLNRPESRNALSAELAAELRALCDTLAQRTDLRGITLRGKGGVFCAGGDLKGFMALAGADGDARAAAVRANREGGELFARLEALPQVLVMLVEGAALAGGLGMLCCADVVAVTGDARFALTETTLGIPPAQIAPFVARRLGLRTARRLMLTAAQFDGTAAGALGLADFVGADSAAIERYESDIRAAVRRCAPGANAATKDILLAARELDGEALREYAAQSFANCLLGEEGREGIAAFLGKRKPRWAQPD